MTEQDKGAPGFSRRSFLKGASAAAVTGTLPAGVVAQTLPKGQQGRLMQRGRHKVELKVNGRPLALTLEPRTTLLDALRDVADLTGTKKICDRGACGGCTVLVEGRPVNSCLMLAMDAVGSEVTTIEGISTDGRLHPVQEAFIRCDALQCGFCTPGFVVSAVACLDRHRQPDLATIRHELSGNLCRCGTYNRVCEAVQLASGSTRRPGGGR